MSGTVAWPGDGVRAGVQVPAGGVDGEDVDRVGAEIRDQEEFACGVEEGLVGVGSVFLTDVRAGGGHVKRLFLEGYGEGAVGTGFQWKCVGCEG